MLRATCQENGGFRAALAGGDNDRDGGTAQSSVGDGVSLEGGHALIYRFSQRRAEGI
jgi:hypothetical protein